MSVAIHHAVAIIETHKVCYMTVLLELASCKVKQLFPGRRRCFYSFRQTERRRAPFTDPSHTIGSAYDISPQGQHSPSLQELKTCQKTATPRPWYRTRYPHVLAKVEGLFCHEAATCPTLSWRSAWQEFSSHRAETTYGWCMCA